MDPVIELKNISVHYEQTVVLKDINLRLTPNVLLGVIGPNGGGKTTLLKVILGLIKPNRGEVKVFGKNPADARELIGYVPQKSFSDRDFPVSVWDVVLMGRLSLPGTSKYRYSALDESKAKEALELVDLFDLRNRQIGELSEGERQRTLIARALVREPKLLLLDEPTASVDVRMQTSLYDLLGRLKGRLTIVMISHDIGVVSSYVDKIACLNVNFYFHDSKEIRKEDLEAAYHCPVDLIGHGLPHRVVAEHKHEK